MCLIHYYGLYFCFLPVYKHFPVVIPRKNNSDSNAEETSENTPSGSSGTSQAGTSAPASSLSSQSPYEEMKSSSFECATVSLFITINSLCIKILIFMPTLEK